jgi:hypothetical protein
VRQIIVAVALACCFPAVTHGIESLPRSLSRDQDRQKMLSEAARLGSEVEVRFEDSAKVLTAKRKARERENLKRNSRDESAGRSSFSFRRGAERLGEGMNSR